MTLSHLKKYKLLLSLFLKGQKARSFFNSFYLSQQSDSVLTGVVSRVTSSSKLFDMTSKKPNSKFDE